MAELGEPVYQVLDLQVKRTLCCGVIELDGLCVGCGETGVAASPRVMFEGSQESCGYHLDACYPCSQWYIRYRIVEKAGE